MSKGAKTGRRAEIGQGRGTRFELFSWANLRGFRGWAWKIGGLGAPTTIAAANGVDPETAEALPDGAGAILAILQSDAGLLVLVLLSGAYVGHRWVFPVLDSVRDQFRAGIPQVLDQLDKALFVIREHDENLGRRADHLEDVVNGAVLVVQARLAPQDDSGEYARGFAMTTEAARSLADIGAAARAGDICRAHTILEESDARDISPEDLAELRRDRRRRRRPT